MRRLEVFSLREMPHLEINADVAGQHFGFVDLRIERYPLPKEQKDQLLHAAINTGVAARLHNQWVVIGPGETIRVGSEEEVKSLPKLPNDWMTYILNEAWIRFGETIHETNDHLPDPSEDGKEYKKEASVWAMKMDEPFDVETLEGPVQGKSGDYLCKGQKGEMWPIDQEIFLQTYAPTMGQVFKKK